MKRRGVTTLAVMLLFLVLFAFVSLVGVSFGIREIKPLATQIKENKLGLDLTGGFFAVYQAKSEGVEDFDEKLDGTIRVLRTRLDSKGMTEATISKQGSDKIRIEIPTTDTDPNSISQYLATPAKLQWKDPDGNVILEGEDIAEANAATDNNGQYVVQFKLTSEGADKFAEATARLIGQNIGIYIDDELISDPTVDETIGGGTGSIRGNFDAESATELAMQIESGALPLDMEEIEVRSIGATLGEDALEKSVTAGIIGVAIIMVFMIVVYRTMGLMADIALLFYILLDLFCILTLPGVQLTLPGIAGLILSIGMAVDANVIIFERIKEEMRDGKSIETSIESGFSKAFSAILDSNVTTLIAAGVLIFFGTGTIKGFAYTLGIGILLSMLTAVLISRTLLRQLPKIGGNNPKMYAGSSKAKETEGTSS